MKNELINCIITPILEKGKLKFLEIERIRRLDEVTKFTEIEKGHGMFKEQKGDRYG